MNETTKCPVCEKGTLKEVWGDYKTEYVARDGNTKPLVIEGLSWLQCDHCGEVVLDELATSAIEAARRKAQGLLTPRELKELRTTLGLTQSQIARLLGIGEKTYCRWESGAYVQSLAFDRYLRLLKAEPRNISLLREMEDSHSEREVPGPAPDFFRAERLIFRNLQVRESLVEMSEVFTDLMTTGQLHVLPSVLPEVI